MRLPWAFCLPLSFGLPAHKQVLPKSNTDLPNFVVPRPSTLVLCEDLPNFELKNSILVKELRDNMSLNTTFADISGDLSLIFKRGVLQYDNIFLFLPFASEFASSSPEFPSRQGLLRAFDSGANIVMVTGAANNRGSVLSSKAVRLLASDFGIKFHSPPNEVFDVRGEQVTFNFGNYLTSIPEPKGSFWYPGGIGHAVMENQDWHRATSLSLSHGNLVSAPKEGNLDPKKTLATGSDLSLVSVVEGENEARALFVGSCSLFSDEYIAKGNDIEYLMSLILWTFRRTGVIKWTKLTHSKIGEKYAPSLYTVKDEVKFCIDLWELKLKNTRHLPPVWEPYTTKNFQIEYIMLDPYYRLFLIPVGEAEHCVSFKVPDVHGVFKFYSNFHPAGYNRVLVESLAPVRNLKHDEYDRFITKAAINYGCCLTSLLTTVVFIFVLFFYKSKQSKTKNE